VLTPVLASLLLGALHALGPDHCVAVAALAARDARPRRIVGLAVRFGLGHLLVLGAGFAALRLAAAAWPGWLDRLGEAAAAAALVAIGLSLLGEGLFARLGIHAHGHVHGGVEHIHPHSHRSGGAHAHGHASGLATGMLFAVGGLRALLVGLPAATAPGAWALAALGAFGLGVCGTMALYGLALSTVLPRLAERRFARAGARLLGAAAVAVGVFQIVSA
jgi:nickel/cobalt transporter (NicO) family protein